MSLHLMPDRASATAVALPMPLLVPVTVEQVAAGTSARVLGAVKLRSNILLALGRQNGGSLCAARA